MKLGEVPNSIQQFLGRGGNQPTGLSHGDFNAMFRLRHPSLAQTVEYIKTEWNNMSPLMQVMAVTLLAGAGAYALSSCAKALQPTEMPTPSSLPVITSDEASAAIRPWGNVLFGDGSRMTGLPDIGSAQFVEVDNGKVDTGHVWNPATVRLTGHDEPLIMLVTENVKDEREAFIFPESFETERNPNESILVGYEIAGDHLEETGDKLHGKWEGQDLTELSLIRGDKEIELWTVDGNETKKDPPEEKLPPNLLKTLIAFTASDVEASGPEATAQPSATSTGTPTLAPTKTETSTPIPPTVAPTLTESPPPTATPDVYQLKAEMPQVNEAEVSLTPALVLDEETMQQMKTLGYDVYTTELGNQHVASLGATVLDGTGFKFSLLPVLPEVMGQDGHLYKLKEQKDLYAVYERVDPFAPNEKVTKIIVVNAFKQADAWVQKGEKVVAFKINNNGVEEIAEQHIFLVPEQAQVIKDLAKPDRSVNVKGEGGGTVWLQIEPRPSPEPQPAPTTTPVPPAPTAVLENPELTPTPVDVGDVSPNKTPEPDVRIFRTENLKYIWTGGGWALHSVGFDRGVVYHTPPGPWEAGGKVVAVNGSQVTISFGEGPQDLSQIGNPRGQGTLNGTMTVDLAGKQIVYNPAYNVDDAKLPGFVNGNISLIAAGDYIYVNAPDSTFTNKGGPVNFVGIVQ